ncbi:MAG: methyltransferase domain-containing protein [Campylobacterota bacterium]|nr:methyltransferase domain-containing protein [Campylobacterota bacterium]
MRVKQEFSRSASEYEQYSIIQQQVAQKLVDDIMEFPTKILDIGCGSGAVNKLVSWDLERYTAIDFSQSMLDIHPKAKNITCKLADFNSSSFFDTIDGDHNRVISASALQWAIDLDYVLKEIAKLKTPVSLAIFTCKTFKSMYECAELEPMLRCSDEIIATAKKHFDAEYELVEYTLKFDTPRDMFRYIKKSGVSGGRRVLSYKQTKQLMQAYPLDYLEFEVLFIQN